MLARWMILWVAACASPAAASDRAPHWFAIRVVDAGTGRGVPLVELSTVNHVCLVTDSNGMAAFYEPGLMDREVFFSVTSHGYQCRADGFGYRGVRLKTTPGGSATIEIQRQNVAERLYRVTGQGIYRDSLLLGIPVPLANPVLSGGVLGCDSVTCAVYHGRIYWFWGDTSRAGYPLGNFHTTGAVSALPGDGGLDPAVGIDFTYFANNDGFVRPMAPFNKQGPTWISGLLVLHDAAGNEQMFAHYVNVCGGENSFQPVERGLARFNDEQERFEAVAVFPLEGPFPHGGHPVLHASGGNRHVYYCDPYPLVRVEADPEKLARPECYEALTCLAPGTRAEQANLDRRADGSLIWAWKPATDPIGPQQQQKLLASGKIRPQEALLALRDVETGEPVAGHRGSVYWNEYRKRWVMIFCQLFGSSVLGEIWYAEADRLTGPWVYARKIVTHHRYSFYNPKQHPMFDQQGGRIIYFEGTYTASFSGNEHPTPWYDYNQIMYRLDLADPRLNLPVAVYDRSQGKYPNQFSTRPAAPGGSPAPIAFWALERPADDSAPVFAGVSSSGTPCLKRGNSRASAEGPRQPVFHVLKAESAAVPRATVLLYEFVNEAGDCCYLPEGASVPEGFDRRGEPLGRVWPHPLDRAIGPGD